MKKAQNLIEVSIILCLVVAFSIATWAIINRQQLKLVNLSKVKVELLGTPSIVNQPPADDEEKKDAPTPPETAGGTAH